MRPGDINDYANSLVIDFLDAFHDGLRSELESAFDDQWFERGVRKHIAGKGYLERTRKMLQSPLRTIDMDKGDEELYGAEHLWNIVCGNWKIFSLRFGDRPEDKNRTETYLREIAELRHNVAHRRGHHDLRRAEVQRAAQTCAILLRGLGRDPDAQHFFLISEVLSAGGTPWSGDTQKNGLAPPRTVGEERQTHLLKHHVRTEVRPLLRSSPRLPAELIKESSDDQGELLRLLADLARTPTIPQQLQLARERRFASLYPASAAECESQLFALSILEEMFEDHAVPRGADGKIRVYDAGCADGGLRTVLAGLEDTGDHLTFSYLGQDINSEWIAYFADRPDCFIELSLPAVRSTESVDLVCCVNTLHLFATNPLLVVSTLQSFNTVLVEDGVCLVIVPEKEAQPGMLEMLGEAMDRAQFQPLSGSRFRITHNLHANIARNAATYLAVIGRKTGIVASPDIERLRGAAFHRAGVLREAAALGVTRGDDIPSDVRALELGLLELAAEEIGHLRFLRTSLLDVGRCQLGSGSLEERAGEIREANLALSRACLEEEPEDRLEEEAARYLTALLKWFCAYFPGISHEDLATRVLSQVRGLLQQTNPEARIRLDNLNPEQVAKLVRNLFEVCDYFRLDLQSAFDEVLAEEQRTASLA